MGVEKAGLLWCLNGSCEIMCVGAVNILCYFVNLLLGYLVI